MSRFPIKRIFGKRKPAPPPVPHVISSMDSVRYPLTKGPSMTSHASDPNPIDLNPTAGDAEGYGAGEYKPGDTSSRLTDEDLRERTARLDDREPCPACRGRGVQLTVNDLLVESIGLLDGNEDVVIHKFYVKLLGVAPDLAALFPPDLLDPVSPAEKEGSPRTGRGQRDRLVRALAALASSYDRGDPEKMAILDTHLAIFGRSHALFQRPDGSMRGATVSEYHFVKVVLFATLHDAAGPAWRPEYDAAWDEAYEYAARHMLAAQDTVSVPFERFRRD